MALPLLWLAATVLFLFIQKAPGQASAGPAVDYQSYYVVVHHHYVLPLAAAFAAFGAVYGAFEAIDRIRYRRVLGYAHLALACLGSLLIFAPSIAINFVALPQRYVDPRVAFSTWSTISAAGYLTMLAGLLLFAVILADAIRLTVVRRVAS
jgi:cytochrome c oxidase subunit 1